MGSCVICGADVDGHVCASHEEDVCFEFRGRKPEELTTGRFYRGTVDGFADFGVFVDIGEHVTGLLHASELDRRLESLEWEPGDTVFVQVKNIRDNGNVDLGWSIRQHESEFRGRIIDTPGGDRLPEEEEPGGETEESPGGGTEEPAESEETAEEAEPDGATAQTDESEPVTRGSPEPEPEPAREPEEAGSATMEAPEETGGAAMEAPLQRTEIGSLGEHVRDPVRIEGTVVEARQTSGPTVFEVRDETGAVECAAFESAGVRAYPEVEAGAVVRLDGVVEERRGDIQVETESIEVLEGEEREAVELRLDEAIAARARPDEVDLLADHPAVESVRDDLVAAATAIRRAVFETRPVVVRHSATTDGYVAGSALERAVLPLIREEHEEEDAEYHYFDRRPLDGRIYDMQDAMRDTTRMLDARERHDERIPLFVFVNAGSTEESRTGFELLDLYGADRVVIDGDHPDDSMADAAGAFVTAPDGEEVSTSALAANVAAHVNDAVRADLRHLPAVGYWRDVPKAYLDLAAEAGYDRGAVETLREAIALEAFYQAYEDKRELIADLLFGEGELAEHASEQFRERVGDEIRTAVSHVDRWEVSGHTIATLDTDAFTHQYDFPPVRVLLAELAEELGDVDAVVGIEADGLSVWSRDAIDMRQVGEHVADAVPDGGVETRGGRDGELVFLSGSRDEVTGAAVEAIADQLA